MNLTPRLEKMIRDKVESGLYSNASEVVREGLRLLEQHDRRHQRQTIDELIQVGLDQIERGEGRELTPELWQSMIERGNEMTRLGEPIPRYISGEDD